MKKFRKAHKTINILSIMCLLLAALYGCAPDGTQQENEEYIMDAKDFDNAGNAAIIRTLYPTDDFVIIEQNAANPPYNADPTGQKDSTLAIQKAIEDLSKAGGGTVWLPAGRYKITKNIRIHQMVTLRGDWRDPDSQAADPDDGGSYGTVIVVDMPPDPNMTGGAFTMLGNSGALGLTIYYPSQSLDDPKPYPFAFDIAGRSIGVGNVNYGLVTLQNITLLNAYRGICAGLTPHEGGEGMAGWAHSQHGVFNIKGTVMCQGLDMRNSADFGVIRGVDIAPRYWAEAGATYNAPEKEALVAYTRANVTAYTMADIEWGNLAGIHCTDVDVGIHFVEGARTRTGFGMYDIRLLNCRQAIAIEELGVLEYPWAFGGDNYYFGYAGIRMTDAVLEANHGEDMAIMDMRWPTILRFTATEFRGGGDALRYEYSGSIHTSKNTMPNAGFIGCAFANWDEGSIVNWSGLEPRFEGCVFNSALSLGASPLPPEEFAPPPTPKAARPVLYNVKDYGAIGDKDHDDGDAIQSALDEAGSEGGGIVYLPAGFYRVNGRLTVPAGVELRGVSPIRNRDLDDGVSLGTMLLAYEGKGTAIPETDEAFITLDGEGAGVRGLRVFYPENNPKYELSAYPYTIRGNGKGVYVVDVGFVNSCYGIDMRTKRCDDLYIKGTVGTFFDRGIVVGGGSENGWILDNLSNPTLTMCVSVECAGEDWLRDHGIVFDVLINPVTRQRLSYIVLDGAKNQHLLSNTVYGGTDEAAFWFTGGSSATVVNCFADGGGTGRRKDVGSEVRVYNWLSSVLDDPMAK